MKTPIDLFNLIETKVSDPNDRKLVLAKYKKYTIQYQSGLGLLGLHSRLTIWRYDYRVCKITCKQLTVNDEKKIIPQIINAFDTHDLMYAINQDQMVSIGNIQQLWRITLGGYIASKRSKWASKGN